MKCIEIPPFKVFGKSELLCFSFIFQTEMRIIFKCKWVTRRGVSIYIHYQQNRFFLPFSRPSEDVELF